MTLLSTGHWTVQKPGNLVENNDQFRVAFASFPTMSTSQAFGLSWLASDFSGNVTARMTTSTAGAVTWAGPSQVSTTSWKFVDVETGDYGSMAAVGDGSNHFYPTWIARNTTSQDVTVTAEWSTP